MPGCHHHVTQRGNNRQDVFFVDDDRAVYLELLKRESEKFALAIEAYCLMTNHIHLIARPDKDDSLSKAIGRTHFLYTRYINRIHGRSGHLWQNRFYSCALDDEHFWTAMAYVERNAVRGRLEQEAWLYRWSSAAAHCGFAGDTSGLLDLAWWQGMLPPDGQWSDALAQPQDAACVKSLRLATARGRPAGSDSFLSKLETAIGRRLRPLPVGRPRRSLRAGN